MPKILVADDSIAVRKVAERLLTEAGLGVALAANGEEAMAFLAKDRADVVVSDVIMPDKSGYEVCAFVRNHSLLAATPVLLISGIVNDEVTKQAESCRADGVLKKPFQGTSLKDKVLELLAKRQSPSAAPAPKPMSDLNQATVSAPPAGFTPFSTSSPSPTPSFDPRSMQGDNREADRPPVPTASVDLQLSNKLREVEGQLRAELARTESLVKRVTDLEAEASQAREMEALLRAERQRVGELESKLAAGELQLSRIPQLEASLREEQASAAKARLEVAAIKNASGSTAQLEATLNAERITAAQLVQQVTDMEVALLAAKGRVAEREAELAAERDRNAMLVRRVSETEQAAVNATKRFEDMTRKLGEIAGLAAQLGKGTGEL